MITPATHRIYTILGLGLVKTTEGGMKEQAVVTELLEEKYGAEEKTGALGSIDKKRRISQGERYVLTEVTGFTDVAIGIVYCDRKPESLAEKERIASEIKKTDKSGL